MLKVPKSSKGKPHASHIRSRKQEKEVAKRIGGRTTPASGSREEKGDCRKKGVVRVECKTTSHKSFSVTLEMIDKIEEAAFSSEELPVILVEFNKDGKKFREVAVVPSYVLDMLTNG